VKTFLDLAPAKMQEEKMNLDGMRNPDFWKEYYQNVQGQIEKINNLLKDLWVASEKPSFSFSDKVNLREVVNSSVEQLSKELDAKKITVENNIPDSLPEMAVDKLKFYRLFDLMLRDEIASLPPGSKITYTAQASSNSGQAQMVQIQIKDNGPGLPQEALRLVFDPFVVRSDSPAEYGIHLMACYFIVHHHGGKIEAKSDAGQGTTFTIRLSINANTAPLPQNEQDFFQKIILNDALWGKLISSE
jgi:signal transduction histidine kinase